MSSTILMHDSPDGHFLFGEVYVDFPSCFEGCWLLSHHKHSLAAFSMNAVRSTHLSILNTFHFPTSPNEMQL